LNNFELRVFYSILYSALTEQTAFQHASALQSAAINAAMLSRVQPRVPLLPPASLAQSLAPGGKFFDTSIRVRVLKISQNFKFPENLKIGKV